MSEFRWKACLSEGNGYTTTLKEKEEDFIVRELDTNGNPLPLSMIIEIDYVNILNSYPFSDEELLNSLLAKKHIGKVRKIKGVITGIESKEDRDLVHTVLSFHPFLYTKTLQRSNGNKDIVVFLDTHHENHIYEAVLTKKGNTTANAVKIIADKLGILERKIKYAGNKDKRGVTTQKITIEGVSFVKLYNICNCMKDKKDIDNSNNSKTKEKKSVDKRTLNECDILNDEDLKMEIDFKLLKDNLLSLQKRIEKVNTEGSKQSNKEYLRLIHEGLKSPIYISSIRRARKTLALGDLGGNRFYIRMDVIGSVDDITKSTKDLMDNGFPNYYGAQRFGYNMLNPKVGKLVLENNYDKAIKMILSGLLHIKNSPRIKEAIEYIEKNELRKAWTTLPRKYQTEIKILQGMDKKMAPKRIFEAIRKENRMMYMNSYQSMLFNDALENRLLHGFREIEYTITGNISNTSSITSEEEIKKRLTLIHNPDPNKVFLPLFPKKDADDKNRENERNRHLRGGYRKAIIKPVTFETSHSFAGFEIVFDLPPGAYATMLIKELTKNMADEDFEK